MTAKHKAGTLVAAVSLIGLSVGMVAAQAEDNSNNQGILIGLSKQHKGMDSQQIKLNSSQIKGESSQLKYESQQIKQNSLQQKGTSAQVKLNPAALNPQPEPPGAQ